MTLKWTWGKALLQDYSNEYQKGYTETQPDAGIPFRRLIFTKAVDLVTCSFSLTRNDYILFMDWYKHSLRQGKEKFDIFDCRYGVERTAQLIGDVPQYTTNSNRFNLTVLMAFEPMVST